MRKIIILTIALLAYITLYAQKTYKYPIAPKDSIYDSYFDTIIYDPYQWMENPNDPRLTDWLKQQKKINNKQSRRQTRKQTLYTQWLYLNFDIKRKKIENNINRKSEEPIKYVFDRYTYNLRKTKNLRYRRKESSVYHKLIETDNYKKNKDDIVTVEHIQVYNTKDIALVELVHNGGDWSELHLFDLKTASKLPEVIKNIISPFAVFIKDGFLYERYDTPKKGRELLDNLTGQALYYHKFKTPQEDDILLYKNPDITNQSRFSVRLIDSLLFFTHKKTIDGLRYNAIGHAPLDIKNPISITDFLIYPDDKNIELNIKYLVGDTIIIKSNWGKPNYNVLIGNINQTNKLEILVPELDIPLYSVNRFGKNKLSCVYKSEDQYIALVLNYKGEILKKFDFPKGKKLNGFFEPDETAEYTQFYLSSYFHPNLYYEISLKDFSIKPIQSIKIPYEQDDFETRYVTYESKDGTQVPMYITCAKDTKLDGTNPTILYGYGGYGTIIEPKFRSERMQWLLNGGIYATPNIRGGGAKGDEWSKKGRGINKQNTIDDFIAAAEYLIEENYTNPEKLAIMGKSHGGMLIGATVTQRPELFKAAIAEAGAFDMLRFHKYTIGSINTNINEFGNINIEEEFLSMLDYSPLHNIKKNVKYPNILLTTGDKDDRVPPHHSYKFLATLQEKGSPQSLYQLYIIPGAGHGGALTCDEAVDKILFQYYYLYEELGIKFW
ncbi:MAG: hypothetical protein C0599_17765 [Salinivirgaceae bacterium]|nr:MAG: hypothetical protein C0599_17765 [Salinivirgaceae bacterium]